MVQVGGDEAAFAERFGPPTRSNVIEFLTIDRTTRIPSLPAWRRRARMRGRCARSSRRRCGRRSTSSISTSPRPRRDSSPCTTRVRFFPGGDAGQPRRHRRQERNDGARRGLELRTVARRGYPGDGVGRGRRRRARAGGVRGRAGRGPGRADRGRGQDGADQRRGAGHRADRRRGAGRRGHSARPGALGGGCGPGGGPGARRRGGRRRSVRARRRRRPPAAPGPPGEARPAGPRAPSERRSAAAHRGRGVGRGDVSGARHP